MQLHELFEDMGQGGSSGFQRGQQIAITNPHASPPTTYQATITGIKQFNGEQYASVQFGTDSNGNYSGPGQAEWQQMSQGNMINLHWARPLQQQQAPQQQAPQQAPQQGMPQQ